MYSIIMKIALFALISLSVPLATYADPKEEIVGSLPEAKVILYATEKEGDLTNFKLKINNETYFFPRWLNSPNITYYPKLYYSDINKDHKKEVVIVLTTDTGSGIILQEAHVFHTNNNGDLLEMLVDNPIAIINKNVKTNLSNSEALVSIGPKKNIIDIRKLNIVPAHIFENVAIGSTLRFDVTDSQLMAKVGVNVAPTGGAIGEIHISYIYKDHMYQAKKVEFFSMEELE